MVEKIAQTATHISWNSALNESLADLTQETQLPNKLVIEMEQPHGSEIAILNTELTTAPEQPIPAVDALISNQPNLILVSRTADCLPILISHPSGWIAAIHAGRASTEAQLLNNVLVTLKQFIPNDTRPYDIWFGPHIHERNYQINRDTDEHYSLIKKNIAQLNHQLSPEAYQLTQDPRCTYSESDSFPSYRRDGKNSSRFYSAITLNVI